MRASGGRLLSKEGADGVVTIGVADEETGIAIKIHDGGQRALNAFASALLLELELVDAAAVAKWHPRTIDTREGEPAGEMVVTL